MVSTDIKETSSYLNQLKPTKIQEVSPIMQYRVTIGVSIQGFNYIGNACRPISGQTTKKSRRVRIKATCALISALKYPLLKDIQNPKIPMVP